MKLKALSFLFVLFSFISCKGQVPLTNNIQTPDTVTALGNNIMAIYQDGKNNYWFGSWKDGLYRYDGKTILHYTTKSGLPHNRVEEIKEDKAGNLYFNTSGGIAQYDGQRFRNLNEVMKQNGNWQLNAGDLWFKSPDYSGKHTYRWDGKTLHRLELPNHSVGEKYLATHPNRHSPYAVYSVYKDSRGNIWFGTAAFGVCRYNGKTFDWITENDVTEMHDGPSNGVRSIIEDGEGYFWFNSAHKYNIYGPNRAERKFYDRDKSIGPLDGKKGEITEYLSIAKTNDNVLWIATYEGCVWRYDGKKVTHYAVREDDRDINLFCIYKDNRDNLWLGTPTNGLFKFDGSGFELFRPGS